MNKPDFLKLAELTAEAQGEIFYIGVKPYGKGWFAHCNNVEWESGDNPEGAVFDVILTLFENAKKAATKASADAKSYEQLAEDLADTVALIKKACI